MYAEGEHPGVLAGAVAVDGGWGLATPGEPGGASSIVWPVRSVTERVFGDSGFLQHGAYEREVTVLAAVGCAGYRYLSVGKLEVVRRSGEKEW